MTQVTVPPGAPRAACAAGGGGAAAAHRRAGASRPRRSVGAGEGRGAAGLAARPEPARGRRGGARPGPCEHAGRSGSPPGALGPLAVRL